MTITEITDSPRLFMTKYKRLQREKTELKRELESAKRQLKRVQTRCEQHRIRNQNLISYIDKLEFARSLKSNEPSIQEISLKKAQKVYEAIQPMFPFVQWSDVVSKRRRRDMTEARQLLVYFLRTREKYTFKAAGDLINRDHSTCMHAIQVVEDLKATDRSFAAKFTEIEKNLPNFVKSK